MLRIRSNCVPAAATFTTIATIATIATRTVVIYSIDRRPFRSTILVMYTS